MFTLEDLVFFFISCPFRLTTMVVYTRNSYVFHFLWLIIEQINKEMRSSTSVETTKTITKSKQRSSAAASSSIPERRWRFDQKTFERRCVPDRLQRCWKENILPGLSYSNWTERIAQNEKIPIFLMQVKRSKSYTGQMTRYHLTRGAAEARTNAEGRLDDTQLDFAVQLYEHAEYMMSDGTCNFDVPCQIFFFLVQTYPGWTTVYWKAALCLSVVGDLEKDENLILNLLRWAVKLEPKNELLCRNIDGFIRILSHPQSLDVETFWSMSRAPKSMGDLQALMAILSRCDSMKALHSKELRELIREKRSKRYVVRETS